MSDIPFNRQKSFVCLDYPADVQNTDKMLETLGGEEQVTKVHNNPSYRMSLKFRPDDAYCKPACGDRTTTNNLLLKVVRRRKLREPGETPYGEDEGWMYHSEIVGVVNTTYQFNSLADFQYLPVVKKPTGQYESIADNLEFKKLEKIDWFERDVPHFIPPTVFSRLDSKSDYNFQSGPKHRENYKDPMENVPSHIIGRARKRRGGYTKNMDFDTKDVPVEPEEITVEKFKGKSCPLLEVLKEVFENRPIWSMLALCAELGQTGSEIKAVVPMVAYLWVTGPWRNLWTRFGYDPRTDPLSKKFQTLDIRVFRQSNEIENVNVVSKRSTFNVRGALRQISSIPKVSTIKPTLLGDESEKLPSASGQIEESHIFRSDSIPPSRQAFYQLCDIEVDEVQKLVRSNDGNEGVCTKVSGWLNPKVLEKSRYLIGELIKKTLKEKGIVLPNASRKIRKCKRMDKKMEESFAELDEQSNSSSDNSVSDLEADEPADTSEMDTQTETEANLDQLDKPDT